MAASLLPASGLICDDEAADAEVTNISSVTAIMSVLRVVVGRGGWEGSCQIAHSLGSESEEPQAHRRPTIPKR